MPPLLTLAHTRAASNVDYTAILSLSMCMYTFRTWQSVLNAVLGTSHRTRRPSSPPTPLAAGSPENSIPTVGSRVSLPSRHRAVKLYRTDSLRRVMSRSTAVVIVVLLTQNRRKKPFRRLVVHHWAIVPIQWLRSGGQRERLRSTITASTSPPTFRRELLSFSVSI